MERYQDFVLLLQVISSKPRSIWFHSETPIEWTDARDRIIATGETKGFTIGGFGEGRFMISVDSHDVSRYVMSGATPRNL